MTTQTGNKTKSKAPMVFDMTSNECIWSKAGVVAYRLCHNAFDCLSCSFDKAIQRKRTSGWHGDGLEQTQENYWTSENWQNTAPHKRYCRHMLTGRVPFKLCPNHYTCARCAYDQMLDDEGLAEPTTQVHMHEAAGFVVPDDYYLHPGHTWARVEYGGRVRIGLDDLAARLFGPADEFRLPQLGMAVTGGGKELAFSRGGRQARAASPIEGVVVARNPKVLQNPAAANQLPYDEGWLLLVEPIRLQRDLKGMHTGEEGVAWMEHESQRLSDLITTDTGQRLAATGGRMVPDIYGAVPGLDWKHLVHEFL